MHDHTSTLEGREDLPKVRFLKAYISIQGLSMIEVAIQDGNASSYFHSPHRHSTHLMESPIDFSTLSMAHDSLHIPCLLVTAPG